MRVKGRKKRNSHHVEYNQKMYHNTNTLTHHQNLHMLNLISIWPGFPPFSAFLLYLIPKQHTHYCSHGWTPGNWSRQNHVNINWIDFHQMGLKILGVWV